MKYVTRMCYTFHRNLLKLHVLIWFVCQKRTYLKTNLHVIVECDDFSQVQRQERCWCEIIIVCIFFIKIYSKYPM